MHTTYEDDAGDARKGPTAYFERNGTWSEIANVEHDATAFTWDDESPPLGVDDPVIFEMSREALETAAAGIGIELPEEGVWFNEENE